MTDPRTINIEKLKTSQDWDIIIIGGGATGLGAALDAVSRGYRTLLLEQYDFAKGTSGKSTKLVHGGVRYLAQGDIRLVREASIERGLLLRNAPHVVRKLEFIVPVFSWWEKIKYAIGLKIYDAIAGRLRLGSAYSISRQEVIDRIPGIKTSGLAGGIVYHDGQFDDARLAINLAQTVIREGGHVLNYMKVCALLKDAAGQVSGVMAMDTETGEAYELHSRAVINATGVFVDDVMRMDNASARNTITASQGIHLVFDKEKFPSDRAMMIPKTSDGRVLFAVPWHGKVVVGTTDTPVEHVSINPKAMAHEIEFILSTANAYLNTNLTAKDVRSIFAGLRPLAAPKEGKQKTKEISRSHKIVVSKSGLFTVLGGKWTTYRKMGVDTIDRVQAHLGWPKVESNTTQLLIHGAELVLPLSDPLYFYGTDATQVSALINEGKDGLLSSLLHIHAAQIRWAVENEMARTPEDFLARRTRASLLNANESLRIAPRVAIIMAGLLGKNQQWIDDVARC